MSRQVGQARVLCQPWILGYGDPTTVPRVEMSTLYTSADLLLLSTPLAMDATRMPAVLSDNVGLAYIFLWVCCDQLIIDR
jgi:hypothetical protein